MLRGVLRRGGIKMVEHIMARLNIFNDRVRTLVDSKLVPLLVIERSTAQLCKLLNTRLVELGEKRTIHANRIHALMSDDVSRGINEGSLDLIERSTESLLTHNDDWEQRSGQRLDELRTDAEQMRLTRGLSDTQIMSQLGIPPAVYRHLEPFDEQRRLNRRITDASGREVARPPSGNPKPDWSFQDVAITRTLQAFRKRPKSKVGLILPTGAGKTRTALRIVLKKLDEAKESKSLVYWVTHRKTLKTQAHRELQRLLSTAKEQIPEDAASLLAHRIRFIMVSELESVLRPEADGPLLIVVDEAHHAAAPSYQPIFETPHEPPALFLTATPNRTDSMPMGVDEVAYTISHRELAERGVITVPEFIDHPVDDFQWLPQQLEDLADFVVDEAAGRFTKTLVMAPRIERVVEFYDAIVSALSRETGHPLGFDDVGYIHGQGNSYRCDNEEFLTIFSSKPRAIIVSAKLLLEGFDDPNINTVILTQPSSSVIQLMQAAGRCVRFSNEKSASYVVQARNDELAYHFDQRWLYQEISDYLRPQLKDIEYTSKGELEQLLRGVLEDHRVQESEVDSVLSQLEAVETGDTCRLLLHGYPYFGDPGEFEGNAQWGVVLETEKNSEVIRGVFNAFCAQGASLSDPSEFIEREAARYGLRKSLASNSLWRKLLEVLTSAYMANEELRGVQPNKGATRPFGGTGPTTWLRYVTFHFAASFGAELEGFLQDCHNKENVVAEYAGERGDKVMVVKFPLPLGGCEAFLLEVEGAVEFCNCIETFRDRLGRVSAAEQVGELASLIAGATYPLLPSRLLLRIECFLDGAQYEKFTLQVQPNPGAGEKG